MIQAVREQLQHAIAEGLAEHAPLLRLAPALDYDRGGELPRGEVGGYRFAGRAVISRALATLPPQDLVPLAAHELQHMSDHLGGRCSGPGLGMELWAHRVQIAFTRAMYARSGYDIVELSSPSLSCRIPVRFPTWLAADARRYWHRGLDLADGERIAHLRYYRSLATIVAAESMAALEVLLGELYP